jgi:hypothetical protein
MDPPEGRAKKISKMGSSRVHKLSYSENPKSLGALVAEISRPSPDRRTEIRAYKLHTTSLGDAKNCFGEFTRDGAASRSRSIQILFLRYNI